MKNLGKKLNLKSSQRVLIIYMLRRITEVYYDSLRKDLSSTISWNPVLLGQDLENI